MRPGQPPCSRRPVVADETYMKLAGRWYHLYRAVDPLAQVIDVPHQHVATIYTDSCRSGLLIWGPETGCTAPGRGGDVDPLGDLAARASDEHDAEWPAASASLRPVRTAMRSKTLTTPAVAGQRDL